MIKIFKFSHGTITFKSENNTNSIIINNKIDPPIELRENDCFLTSIETRENVILKCRGFSTSKYNDNLEFQNIIYYLPYRDNNTRLTTNQFIARMIGSKELLMHFIKK